MLVNLYAQGINLTGTRLLSRDFKSPSTIPPPGPLKNIYLEKI